MKLSRLHLAEAVLLEYMDKPFFYSTNQAQRGGGVPFWGDSASKTKTGLQFSVYPEVGPDKDLGNVPTLHFKVGTYNHITQKVIDYEDDIQNLFDVRVLGRIFATLIDIVRQYITANGIKIFMVTGQTKDKSRMRIYRRLINLAAGTIGWRTTERIMTGDEKGPYTEQYTEFWMAQNPEDLPTTTRPSKYDTHKGTYNYTKEIENPDPKTPGEIKQGQKLFNRNLQGNQL